MVLSHRICVYNCKVDLFAVGLSLLHTFLHIVWWWQVCSGRSKWIPSYAGPFIMYMERIESCPTPSGKENMFDIHMRPSRFRNPTLIQTTLQTVDGNFTWKAKVDDTWAGLLKFDVWANNQWKENSLINRIPKAYCSVVRSNFPGLYETFYGYNAWSKEPCRFEEKTFIVDNAPINWTFPNFPLMPYGRFRNTNTVWSPKKDRMACFRFELIIVPKVQ